MFFRICTWQLFCHNLDLHLSIVPKYFVLKATIATVTTPAAVSFSISFLLRCHVYYILHSHYLISIVVPSCSSSFVGFFFGSSMCSTPLLILALTLEGTISSGIGMLRYKELYERSLYTYLFLLFSDSSSFDCS